MAFAVVWALEAGGKPQWLRVRDLAEISLLLLDDFWLLALDCAYAKRGCVFLDDFVAVEAKIVGISLFVTSSSGETFRSGILVEG